MPGPKSYAVKPWSLGIILLNLATGWKSATPNDPTFQAYLRDPMGFLPSVLPISAQVNKILVRMLEVARVRVARLNIQAPLHDAHHFSLHHPEIA
jgi:hypothetical protein